MYSAAKGSANPSLLDYNFIKQNYTVSPESHKHVELLLVNTANCPTVFQFGPLFSLACNLDSSVRIAKKK